jgi:citrate synthase
MSGLEGVIAAETILSDVDGEAGRLIIRGRSLDELARKSRYEDVLALLWAELIDQCPDASGLATRLGAARLRVFHSLRAVDHRLLERPPFDIMLSLLTRIDESDDLTTALSLVAAPAVLMPAVIRLRRGLEPLPPDPGLPHSTDVLRMMNGTAPGPAQVSALDRYLVTASDHGLNASTFTARVIASTHAGLAAAVIGALCALKGPLHGGAPGPVLDMLDAIGEPDHAHAWLEAALTRGERLMGFGHRVYRVRDPRADALKAALRLLVQSGDIALERLRLAEAVEHAALALLARRKPDRPLETNVEFYTALLLEALGFPRDTFTCIFAASRVGGWIAHAREQMLRGRLIRPQSRYVGPQAAVA